MRKKIAYILLIFLSTALHGFSQNIELLFADEPVNNDTIEVYGDISADTLSMYIYLGDTTYYYNYEVIAEVDVKNTSSSSLNIHCKKRYLHIVPQTENTFCWVSCFGPYTFQSVNPVNIPANSTSTIFSGHYIPKGRTGCTYIAYTFFDSANVSDSATVIVKFVMGSCDENAIEQFESKNNIVVFPNPANAFFFIENDRLFNLASIELYNTSGQLVSKQKIESGTQIFEVNTSNLKSGLYFYRINLDSGLVKNGQVMILKE